VAKSKLGPRDMLSFQLDNMELNLPMEMMCASRLCKLGKVLSASYSLRSELPPTGN